MTIQTADWRPGARRRVHVMKPTEWQSGAGVEGGGWGDLTSPFLIRETKGEFHEDITAMLSGDRCVSLAAILNLTFSSG